jgi:hypothetical protein
MKLCRKGFTIMKVDESIRQIAEKLETWFNGILPLLESNDTAAQSKALLEGVEIAKEFDRIKKEGITVLNELLNRQDNNADGRVASLVQGFVFGVQLMGALYELGDTDSGNKVAGLVRGVVRKLDAIEPGGDNLAALLDHPDDLVRVYAGQYLIDRMPERVVPVLRLIEEKREGRQANIRAMTVLFPWDWDQKEKERSAGKK